MAAKRIYQKVVTWKHKDGSGVDRSSAAYLDRAIDDIESFIERREQWMVDIDMQIPEAYILNKETGEIVWSYKK